MAEVGCKSKTPISGEDLEELEAVVLESYLYDTEIITGKTKNSITE